MIDIDKEEILNTIDQGNIKRRNGSKIRKANFKKEFQSIIGFNKNRKLCFWSSFLWILNKNSGYKLFCYNYFILFLNVIKVNKKKIFLLIYFLLPINIYFINFYLNKNLDIIYVFIIIYIWK